MRTFTSMLTHVAQETNHTLAGMGKRTPSSLRSNRYKRGSTENARTFPAKARALQKRAPHTRSINASGDSLTARSARHHQPRHVADEEANTRIEWERGGVSRENPSLCLGEATAAQRRRTPQATNGTRLLAASRHEQEP